MHAADEMSDFLEGFDRIAGPVKNHVGGIEVDEQVIAFDIVDEIEQMVSGLLTGFEIELLSVRFGRDREDLA